MKISAKRLFSVALLCLGAVFTLWLLKGKSLTLGQYLRGVNGAHIIVDRRGEPIVMGERANARLFEDLETGDRVLVLHGGRAEVYPARSAACWCLRLGTGQADKLPRQTLDQLIELGWLSADPF